MNFELSYKNSKKLFEKVDNSHHMVYVFDKSQDLKKK